MEPKPQTQRAHHGGTRPAAAPASSIPESGTLAWGTPASSTLLSLVMTASLVPFLWTTGLPWYGWALTFLVFAGLSHLWQRAAAQRPAPRGSRLQRQRAVALVCGAVLLVAGAALVLPHLG